MQVKDLIKQSEELKKEADSIISETNIVGLLNKIGKIDFVGSYHLNLLYRPDIDLFVSTDRYPLKYTQSL